MRRKRDLVVDPNAGVLGVYWSLLWPLFLWGQIARIGWYISTYWLGREVGKEGLAIIALATPIDMIVEWTIVSITAGTGSLVAREVGADSGKALTKAASAAALAFGYGLLLCILGLIFQDQLAAILMRGKSAGARDELTRYLTWFWVGLPLYGVMRVAVQTASSAGRPQLGTMRIFAHVIILAILIPVLLFEFDAGTAAPSAAETASYVLVTSGICITIWRLRESLGLGNWTASSRLWQPKLWGAIMKIGAPIQIARIFSFFIIGFFISLLTKDGEAVTGGFGIAIMLILAGASVTLALSHATGIFVGQNIGSKQPERARSAFSVAVRLEIAIALALALLFPFSRPIVEIFTEDKAVADATMDAINIMRWQLFGLGMWQLLEQVFTAAGKTRLPAVLLVVVDLLGLASLLLLLDGDLSRLDLVAWTFVGMNTAKALLLALLLGRCFLRPLRELTRAESDAAVD